MAEALVSAEEHREKVPSETDGHVNNNSERRKSRPKALKLHHLSADSLRDILSRLEFKEAARMSVLSSKWRRLWRYYPNPVFTRETMFSSSSNGKRSRKEFISNVNSVLRQLRLTTLFKFVVKFKLRKQHIHHVDRWVSFAAVSKAKQIVFDFSPGSWGDDRDSRYNFPLHYFNGLSGSPVRSLHLMFVCLKPPPDFCGFTNLKELKLDTVSIPGHIQCLLPECAVLEWLCIMRCTLQGLQTTQPLCRLHYLHVKACRGMQKIELQAPNLAKFRFYGCPMPIVLNGCSKMEEVTVVLIESSDCFDYAFTELRSGIPHVQKLSMELVIETKMQGFTKCASRFVNLRHLVLTVNIYIHEENTGGVRRLAYLLELAPVLEHLELHMRYHGEGETNRRLEDIAPHSPHTHLKMVYMTGVYGYRSLLELAVYIAQNALVLERMIIDPMAKKTALTRSDEAQFAVPWGRKMAKQHLLGLGLDDILTIL